MQTSYQQLMKMKPACLRRRIMVSFVREEGMDAGGLTRFHCSEHLVLWTVQQTAEPEMEMAIG